MTVRSVTVRPVVGAVLASALATALAAFASGAGPVAPKTHPTKTETRALIRAVPAGQTLCYAQNAWISGVDRRYGVVVTQASCGGSVYLHLWLERASTTTDATWHVVRERSGTIDHPAGCTTAKRVPADIRCL